MGKALHSMYGWRGEIYVPQKVAGVESENLPRK